MEEIAEKFASEADIGSELSRLEATYAGYRAGTVDKFRDGKHLLPWPRQAILMLLETWSFCTARTASTSLSQETNALPSWSHPPNLRCGM